MRPALTLTIVLLLTSQMALALEPGEKVVVTRPAAMQATTGSAVGLMPGTTLVVQSVDGDRLTVAAGRIGQVAPAALIAAAKADDYFSQLITKAPQDAVAWLARGRLRFDRGEHDAAIADLDQCLSIAESSDAHTIRGFAWKRKGDKEKAMADFDAAIKLDSKNDLAWRVRGATWAGKADYKKAVEEYSESIRLDPDNPESLHHRAVMLSACTDDTIRNGKQAILDATKACEVSDWKDSLFLVGLAMASAEVGDFDAAVKWQTKAIELSPTGGQSMQPMLALFREHKPHRATWR